MDFFTSTYVNKVDKKGRVSIPAPFRTTLSKAHNGEQTEVVVFPSLQTQSLEACTTAYLANLHKALDDPNMDEDQRELIEDTVFGNLVRLTLDPEGRIILPDHLLEHAGITENVSFIGKRNVFQLWEPTALAAHRQEKLERARSSKMSLSTVVAKAKGGH